MCCIAAEVRKPLAARLPQSREHPLQFDRHVAPLHVAQSLPPPSVVRNLDPYTLAHAAHFCAHLWTHLSHSQKCGHAVASSMMIQRI